jgi:hypothetical protein
MKLSNIYEYLILQHYALQTYRNLVENKTKKP